jgi:predicted porin
MKNKGRSVGSITTGRQGQAGYDVHELTYRLRVFRTTSRPD